MVLRMIPMIFRDGDWLDIDTGFEQNVERDTGHRQSGVDQTFGHIGENDRDIDITLIPSRTLGMAAEQDRPPEASPLLAGNGR